MTWWQKLEAAIVAPKLSTDERQEFTAAVEIVRRGMRSFLEAGEALARIKAKQLYREQFPTFETFAESTFGLTGRRLTQLVESFEIVKTLKSISPNTPTPTMEGVVRPLSGLKPHDQVHAYQEAVEAAGGQVPTPAQVKVAAASRRPNRKKRIAKPIRYRVPGATVVVVPNRAFESPAAALTAALDQLRKADAA